MPKSLASFNHAFASGAAGGAFSVFFFWVLAKTGFLKTLGISHIPSFEGGALASRILAGGLLGLLLLFPLLKIDWKKKALLLSLIPATLDFFCVFPSMGLGNLGIRAGFAMPGVILAVNAGSCLFALGWAKKTGSLV